MQMIDEADVNVVVKRYKEQPILLSEKATVLLAKRALGQDFETVFELVGEDGIIQLVRVYNEYERGLRETYTQQSKLERTVDEGVDEC
ncbi:hypothetical protein J4442_03555 [Candidatus Woesearchaeota archaeon]|nr:hypothetical protein [Candidatus Woesearchaeota archaeon]